LESGRTDSRIPFHLFQRAAIVVPRRTSGSLTTRLPATADQTASIPLNAENSKSNAIFASSIERPLRVATLERIREIDDILHSQHRPCSRLLASPLSDDFRVGFSTFPLLIDIAENMGYS